MANPSDRPNAQSLADRKQAVKAAIERALVEHQCALNAIPAFQSDGRGGFFVTCQINIRGNEERA